MSLIDSIKSTLAEKFSQFGFTKDMTDAELDQKLSEMPTLDSFVDSQITDQIDDLKESFNGLEEKVTNLTTDVTAIKDSTKEEGGDGEGGDQLKDFTEDIEEVNTKLDNLEEMINTNSTNIADIVGDESITDKNNDLPRHTQSESDFISGVNAFAPVQIIDNENDKN